MAKTPPHIEQTRVTAALVDTVCTSFDAVPSAITFDIDHVHNPVHGRQQLSLFHTYYDTCRVLYVEVYHAETGKLLFAKLQSLGFVP